MLPIVLVFANNKAKFSTKNSNGQFLQCYHSIVNCLFAWYSYQWANLQNSCCCWCFLGFSPKIISKQLYESLHFISQTIHEVGWGESEGQAQGHPGCFHDYRWTRIWNFESYFSSLTTILHWTSILYVWYIIDPIWSINAGWSILKGSSWVSSKWKEFKIKGNNSDQKQI